MDSHPSPGRVSALSKFSDPSTSAKKPPHPRRESESEVAFSAYGLLDFAQGHSHGQSVKGIDVNPQIENVDDVDRQIAACLQVNGRAGWGRIARVLDLPERTVARRGQRLLESGIVKVSTSIDSTKVAHARPLLLRIRTGNGKVWPIARALAARSDASSVSILEGSNEISAMFMLRDRPAIRAMLFEDLPATDGILHTSATTVLRFFRTGYDWYPPILTEEMVEQLRPSYYPADDSAEGEVSVLSSDEEAVVNALSVDGRLSVKAISDELGITPVTAKRRVESLLGRGILHVRTEVVPSVFGFGLEVLLWLSAPSHQIDQIGVGLSKHSSIKFCAASTGTSMLWVNGLFQDEEDFYSFVTGEFFLNHPEVRLEESLIVLTPVLRGSLLVDDGPWLDDEIRPKIAK